MCDALTDQAIACTVLAVIYHSYQPQLRLPTWHVYGLWFISGTVRYIVLMLGQNGVSVTCFVVYAHQFYIAQKLKKKVARYRTVITVAILKKRQ